MRTRYFKLDQESFPAGVSLGYEELVRLGRTLDEVLNIATVWDPAVLSRRLYDLSFMFEYPPERLRESKSYNRNIGVLPNIQLTVKTQQEHDFVQLQVRKWLPDNWDPPLLDALYWWRRRGKRSVEVREYHAGDWERYLTEEVKPEAIKWITAKKEAQRQAELCRQEEEEQEREKELARLRRSFAPLDDSQ